MEKHNFLWIFQSIILGGIILQKFFFFKERKLRSSVHFERYSNSDSGNCELLIILESEKREIISYIRQSSSFQDASCSNLHKMTGESSGKSVKRVIRSRKTTRLLTVKSRETRSGRRRDPMQRPYNNGRVPGCRLKQGYVQWQASQEEAVLTSAFPVWRHAFAGFIVARK